LSKNYDKVMLILGQRQLAAAKRSVCRRLPVSATRV
jgi:hypothetical protein